MAKNHPRANSPTKQVTLPIPQLRENELRLQPLLIKAQADYIKMLHAELDELVPFAAPHGWQSTRYLIGLASRANIENITALLPNQPQA